MNLCSLALSKIIFQIKKNDFLEDRVVIAACVVKWAKNRI